MNVLGDSITRIWKENTNRIADARDVDRQKDCEEDDQKGGFKRYKECSNVYNYPY